MNNSFGDIFRITTFGESHGPALGGVIDGMPAGICIDLEKVQHQLNRRRPGQSAIVTSRNENDSLEILSGIFEGQTTGQPIGFIIRNTNQHSSDYNILRNIYRPSHADYTYSAKYGIRDHRGGGRSSARETVSRVVAGAFAMQALQKLGITITAYTSAVGPLKLSQPWNELNLEMVDSNPVRCPQPDLAAEMENLIRQVKSEGDTVGGVISCVIRGCPPGLGDPAFGKLHARLASAMMSINAAKGFDYGMGFEGAERRGSETIDCFEMRNSRVAVTSNNSGGIQGGISNGADICFRVAFKPVATLLRDVSTVDVNGNNVSVHAQGRHDPCVVPRAVPVVEAMTAIVLLDCWLKNKTVTL